MAINASNTNLQNVEDFLSHCHLRKFKAKTTIIYTGDKGESLYYIVAGSAAVVVEDEDGHE
ncbi:MAG: cyclic nucleotide-binding domain-containing protein, partial [Psychrosphaera sp.]|nr:cyclic nucleotide-binding domain-containing protein [Psychrosphaera sp.]